MHTKSYLVTGGSGSIGANLANSLVVDGYRVRVLDDNSRGAPRRLSGIEKAIEFIPGDIRDSDAVARACRGVDAVCHLAFVNGTEFFYSKPELVLDVGVRGIVNVIDGCLAAGVRELILASSSEVYQTPPETPTPETIPLVISDPLNPRYSYGGGKIISELMALNYGRRYFDSVRVFRPHNVYGPDMGWEHVLPQFVMRMRKLVAETPRGTIAFPIQGSGEETRAFVYIDDAVDGIRTVMDRGGHLEIFNVGTENEARIADVARLVGSVFGREIEIIPGRLQPGSTLRRCPDISKLQALGFAPNVTLEAGLPRLANWYIENADLFPNLEQQ